MNKLQKLDTNLNIFVSLNPSTLPSKKKIFKEIYYDHPLFDFNTFENQKNNNNSRIRNIWFCGAYLGYGFHEDGVTSALNVVKKILERENGKINNNMDTLYKVLCHIQGINLYSFINYRFYYFWFSLSFKHKYNF